MRRLGNMLGPYALFALLLLASLTVSRVLLAGWQLERVLDADMLGNVLLQGLRFDLVLLGFLCLWPLLTLPLLGTSRLGLRIGRPLLLVYFVACLTAAVFLEAATPAFIAQFDARPNRLFFEYIAYPKEVVSTLKAAYLGELALAFVLVAATIMISRRLLGASLRLVQPVPVILALLATPALALGSIALARSTFDHRAVNPSTVALSTDPMVNDLALNSAYTLLYALVEEQGEPPGGFRYSEMPKAEVIDQVRSAMAVDAESYVDDDLPSLHWQTATRIPDRPKNLVIVLEESLGAEFVGSLGGLPLTPRLDALADQGWWFESMYATGTRSVRGIEAIITGFTPTPSRSVVKLGGSQRNFFTIAQLLKEHGYDTSFIYGGESQFDNMRRFFMNNGFETVVDEKDYDDAVFLGSWGASDEDLFRHAHAEFSKPRKRPFFSLVFTTTNHTPYEFPDGRIELYDAEKNTVNNAVKYADYALGEFIDTARKSSYWNDTVFLIVADHNSRVYGADLVPVERFHIPALILGADIEPTRFAPVASQIDLPPTLLSLIGISAAHPMIGHDLTAPGADVAEGRAIMQYYGTQGYMQGDQVVIMRKDLEPEQFRYDGRELVAVPQTDPLLAERALAHANWSSMAYEQKLYRLPSSAGSESAAPVTALSQAHTANQSH